MLPVCVVLIRVDLISVALIKVDLFSVALISCNIALKVSYTATHYCFDNITSD